jgi:hypothetical protein
MLGVDPGTISRDLAALRKIYQPMNGPANTSSKYWGLHMVITERPQAEDRYEIPEIIFQADDRHEMPEIIFPEIIFED